MICLSALRDPVYRLKHRAKLMRNTVRSGDCLLWTGPKFTEGYGRFSFGSGGNHAVGAHRAAWTLLVGVIPQGMMVLHRCRNKHCVAVDHLYLGTRSDNTKDSIRDGTWNAPHLFKKRAGAR